MGMRPYRPNPFTEAGRHYTAMQEIVDKLKLKNTLYLERIGQLASENKQLRETIASLVPTITVENMMSDLSKIVANADALRMKVERKLKKTKKKKLGKTRQAKVDAERWDKS